MWAFNVAMLSVLTSVGAGSAAPATAEVVRNGTKIVDQMTGNVVDASFSSVVATPTVIPGDSEPVKVIVSGQFPVKRIISPRLSSMPASAHSQVFETTTRLEQKFPLVDDADNMVMSEKDVHRLKPNQKKIEQQQHQKNVEEVIGEAEFDSEHYSDISSVEKESEEMRKDHASSHDRLPQDTFPGPAETTDALIFQKVMEFLGLEDFNTQHPGSSKETLNQSKLGRIYNDDDTLIVKSVKVNVRKL